MYDEIAPVSGYTMLPFGMETYGGVGREALTTLEFLAAHCRSQSKRDFLRHALHSLSVTLQR